MLANQRPIEQAKETGRISPGPSPAPDVTQDHLETDGLPVGDIEAISSPPNGGVGVLDARHLNEAASFVGVSLPIVARGGFLAQSGDPVLGDPHVCLARSLGLDRFVTVLNRNSHVRIGAGALVLDVDGTIFRGTNRWMHNSLGGRNHLALELLIERVTERSVSLTEDQWRHFETAIGKGQKADAVTVVGVLNALPASFFRVDSKGVAHPEDFLECMAAVVNTKISDWVADKRIGPVDRVEELIDRAYRQGYGLCVCTCSDRDTLHPLFRQHFKRPELSAWLDNAVWSAVKRTESGDFTGESVLAACQAMRVAPERVVMFGDGISDVVAAKQAGVRRVVIRPELEDADYERDGLRKVVGAIAEQANKISQFGDDFHIVVVCCYNQIVFDPPPGFGEVACFDVRPGLAPPHEVYPSDAASEAARLFALSPEEFRSWVRGRR